GAVAGNAARAARAGPGGARAAARIEEGSARDAAGGSASRLARQQEVVVNGRWIPIVGVVLWALLASQHLFYAVGLGDAQRALGGPAYVELRNAIDDVMRRNLPFVYVATLVWTVLLIVRGGPGRFWFVVALAGLLGDAAVML